MIFLLRKSELLIRSLAKSISNRKLSFLLAFSFLFLLTNISVAQIDVQIGGEPTAATIDYLPIDDTYVYSYSQVLYMEEEFYEVGVTGEHLITKIRYLPSYTTSTATWRNWEVYMGNTSKEAFTSMGNWVPLNQMEMVFSGQIPEAAISGEWFEIVFDIPFEWDGHSNIVLAVNEVTPHRYSVNPGNKAYSRPPEEGSKGLAARDHFNVINPANPITGNSAGSVVPIIQFEMTPIEICSGIPDAGFIDGPTEFLHCEGWPMEFQILEASMAQGMTYEWRSKPTESNEPWTVRNTDLKLEIPAGEFMENMEYVFLATCSNSGITSSADTIRVSLKPYYRCICKASSSQNSKYLYSITSEGGFTDLNFNINEPPPNGYVDETEQILEVYSSQEITINTKYNQGGNGIRIWADWNKDRHLDEDELLAGFSSGSTNKSLTFTIPNGIQNGDYGMRVRGSSSSGVSAIPPACGNDFEGSTVDFLLRVVDPPYCLETSELALDYFNSNEALVFWNHIGVVSEWELSWGEVGFTPGDEFELGTATSLDTSFLITGLEFEQVIDVYVRSKCGENEYSIWSSPITIDIDYCDAFFNFPDVDYIKTINSIGAVTDISYSTNSGPPQGYAKEVEKVFEAYSGQQFVIEATYTIEVHNFYIWVDWDNDLVFDEDELMITANSISEHSLVFTVPLGIPEGEYRMRLRASNGSFTYSVSPCGKATRGSTVDFTLKIVEQPSCMEVIDLQLDYTSIENNEIAFEWTPIDTETMWEVVWGTSGFTPGDEDELGNDNTIEPSYTIQNAIIDLNYDVYVRANCSEDDQSLWVGPLSVVLEYCKPDSKNCTYRHIDNFTLVGANNTAIIDLETNCFPGGYDNRIEETGTVDLEVSETYKMLITTPLISEKIVVWIDFNDNGVFEVTERVVYGAPLNDYNVLSTIDLPIPENGELGVHRMRVMMYSSGVPNACGAYIGGETHDYQVNIVEPTCDAGEDLTLVRCVGSTVDLEDVIGVMPSQGSTWHNESFDLISSASVEVEEYTTIYYHIVTKQNCADTSMLTINSVTEPSVRVHNVEVCESFTWIDGVTYTESTNDPLFIIPGGASTGCDSIINLNLTVFGAAEYTQVVTACESFTWINGETYTSSTSGQEVHTIYNGSASGCDSIITLDLTIGNTNSEWGIDVVEACKGFVWIDGHPYYQDNNTSTFVIQGGASNGCDSIVALDLTIIPVSAGIGQSSETCKGEEINLFNYLDGTPDLEGTWFDQEGYILTSSVVVMGNDTGEFTFEYLVEKDGCEDVAIVTLTVMDCIASIMTESISNIVVYPNPTTNHLNLFIPSDVSNLNIELLDINGRVVFSKYNLKKESSNMIIDIKGYETGVYLLKMFNENGQKTIKVVKN